MATNEEPDHDFTLTMKIHIDPNGRVALAGPVPFELPFGAYDTAFASCAVTAVEAIDFPPPATGTAIMLVPLEHHRRSAAEDDRVEKELVFHQR